MAGSSGRATGDGDRGHFGTAGPGGAMAGGAGGGGASQIFMPL